MSFKKKVNNMKFIDRVKLYRRCRDYLKVWKCCWLLKVDGESEIFVWYLERVYLVGGRGW